MLEDLKEDNLIRHLMCVLLQVEVTERTNKNWKDLKTAVWEVNDDELGLEHVLLNMPSGHTAAGEKADL